MFFKRPLRFGENRQNEFSWSATWKQPKFNAKLGVLKTSLAGKQEDSAINQFINLRVPIVVWWWILILTIIWKINNFLVSILFHLRPSPFFSVFSFGVECVSWYLVGRPSVGLKKNKIKKKITGSLGTGGPGSPGWCYVAMLLLCSFFGLKN